MLPTDEPKRKRGNTFLSDGSTDSTDIHEIKLFENVPEEEFVHNLKEYNSDRSVISKVVSFLNCFNLPHDVFVLWTMLFFNGTFAMAELFGAVRANSLSLYGDVSTMLLDSFTYMLNIYAESQKYKSDVDVNSLRHKTRIMKIEISVTGFSIAILFSVTTFLLNDAIRRLRAPEQHDKGDDEVSSTILLRFSSVNLLIDIIACFFYCTRYWQPTMDASPETGGFIGEEADQLGVESLEENEVQEKENEKNLNMASAFLHLGADTMRTVTVMVIAIVMKTEDDEVSSTDADAIGSLIVSLVIILMGLKAGILICQVFLAAELFQVGSH
eukprot:snap_masked-scaffold_49-processed-gene-1.59-mRNA-1 protein AED:0.22 eAED:1.00 QI:0/0/0/1/1/1/2/0/326